MKKQLMSVAALLFAFSAQAAEFSGAFEGFDGGLISVSGRSYPLTPDAAALYEGRLIGIRYIPAGTPVRFELIQVEGVSTVDKVIVDEQVEELDARFPEA